MGEPRNAVPGRWYANHVDAYFADRPEALERVMRGNALSLLPRLRKLGVAAGPVR